MSLDDHSCHRVPQNRFEGPSFFLSFFLSFLRTCVLCFALLCFALLCFALLCFALLCVVLRRFACAFALLSFALLSCALLSCLLSFCHLWPRFIFIFARRPQPQDAKPVGVFSFRTRSPRRINFPWASISMPQGEMAFGLPLGFHSIPKIRNPF